MKLKNITTFNFLELKKFTKIYVLVSGGFDSTYLYEIIKEIYPEKTIPVNCFNPYEYNKTLKKIKENDSKYISIKPAHYKDVIKDSFLKIPKALQDKKNKKYDKKVFKCCRVIKHQNFKKDNRFKENNSVIISGIKRGDGSQRRIFLLQMNRGSFKSLKDSNPTYYLKHKDSKILYCYPFRDYTKRELPDTIKDKLYSKYPFLEHSGCVLCPVLVVFNLISEGDRYFKSIKYAKNLGVIKNENNRP